MYVNREKERDGKNVEESEKRDENIKSGGLSGEIKRKEERESEKETDIERETE